MDIFTVRKGLVNFNYNYVNKFTRLFIIICYYNTIVIYNKSGSVPG